MREQLADFVAVVGVTPEGQFDAAFDALAHELRWGIVGVVVDLRRSAVLVEEPNRGFEQALRYRHPSPPKDPERVTECPDSVFEQ